MVLGLRRRQVHSPTTVSAHWPAQAGERQTGTCSSAADPYYACSEPRTATTDTEVRPLLCSGPAGRPARRKPGGVFRSSQALFACQSGADNYPRDIITPGGAEAPALIAGLLIAADAKEDEAKKDLVKPQGTWVLVSSWGIRKPLRGRQAVAARIVGLLTTLKN